LIYFHELDINLPDYTDKNINYSQDWYKTEDHFITNIKDVFRKVPKTNLKLFDPLFFYYTGSSIVSHVGIVVSDNKFIHIFENSKSRIDRFSGFWESKLYSAMRYING